jgi:hypothetical protein
MGVWDFQWFQQEIDKWMKLSTNESLSESDRCVYLMRAEDVIQSRDRYAKEWEINAASRKGDLNG